MRPSQDPPVDQLLDDLARTRAKLAEAQRDLAARRESATAEDHLVTATVGADGALVDLTFHTERYREMAPAELAAAILAVVGRARTAMSAAVADAFAPFGGGALRDLARGRIDQNAYLERLTAAVEARGDGTGGRR